MPQYSVFVEMTPFIVQVEANNEDEACEIAEEMVKSNDADYNFNIYSNLYCKDAWEE